MLPLRESEGSLKPPSVALLSLVIAERSEAEAEGGTIITYLCLDFFLLSITTSSILSEPMLRWLLRFALKRKLRF